MKSLAHDLYTMLIQFFKIYYATSPDQDFEASSCFSKPKSRKVQNWYAIVGKLKRVFKYYVHGNSCKCSESNLVEKSQHICSMICFSFIYSNGSEFDEFF